MLTDSLIDSFVALAGPTFDWACKGGQRPSSKVRQQLRADILARQGGICAQCGKDAVRPEFCHIVARGPKVRGFFPGNVFAGCASCNASTKPTYDENGDLIAGIEVLRVADFARPDLVPMEWTPFPILEKLPRG